MCFWHKKFEVIKRRWAREKRFAINFFNINRFNGRFVHDTTTYERNKRARVWIRIDEFAVVVNGDRKFLSQRSVYRSFQFILNFATFPVRNKQSNFRGRWKFELLFSNWNLMWSVGNATLQEAVKDSAKLYKSFKAWRTVSGFQIILCKGSNPDTK